MKTNEPKFGLGQRVRLEMVDHDGYCGRDLHPTDDQIGRVGIVLEIERDSDLLCSECCDVLFTEDIKANDGHCPECDGDVFWKEVFYKVGLLQDEDNGLGMAVIEAVEFELGPFNG